VWDWERIALYFYAAKGKVFCLQAEEIINIKNHIGVVQYLSTYSANQRRFFKDLDVPCDISCDHDFFPTYKLRLQNLLNAPNIVFVGAEKIVDFLKSNCPNKKIVIIERINCKISRRKHKGFGNHTQGLFQPQPRNCYISRN